MISGSEWYACRPATRADRRTHLFYIEIQQTEDDDYTRLIDGHLAVFLAVRILLGVLACRSRRSIGLRRTAIVQAVAGRRLDRLLLQRRDRPTV